MTDVLPSNVPEYSAGWREFMSGNLGRARELFEACVLTPAISDDARWTFLKSLGNVEHALGNNLVGNAYFAQLIAMDPKSPLGHLAFSESLLRHAKEPTLALHELELAKQNLGLVVIWDAEQLSRSYYEAEIDRLQTEISNSRGA